MIGRFVLGGHMNLETTTSQSIEKVLIEGDLSALSTEAKLSYYKKVCESVGLNPLTKPFEYIRLNGKVTLYATRACTEQLRKIHNVSLKIVSRETIGDVYVVTAQARTGTREDESTGAVTIKGLTGDNLANAFMKAETKAKRRVTLSVCGLGLLDESEVSTVKGAEIVREPLPSDKQTTQVETKPVAPVTAARTETKATFPEFPGKTKATKKKVELESEINPPPPSFEDLAFAPSDIEELLPIESKGSYEPPPMESLNARDFYTVPFGKNKGLTYAQVGVETLSKSLWAAKKAMTEKEGWVDKVGLKTVEFFVNSAEQWIDARTNQ